MSWSSEVKLGKLHINGVEYDWKASRPVLQKELENTARLVSAAPELLGVLKSLRERMALDICLDIQLAELIKRIEGEQ